MPTVANGMILTGLLALLFGLLLARPRVAAARGPGKLLALAPAFAATALAMFAAEHFLAARALSAIVPRWLPSPLFWTWLVGFALLAAALSFIASRCVLASSFLLALLFLIIVFTIDLPVLPAHLHQRLFWTLTLRETAFAAGALVLTASVWSSRHALPLARIARVLLAAIFLFYAAQHFLFPRVVPGVPLEKLTPAFIPEPILISFLTGAILLIAAIGILIPRPTRLAAAIAGATLLLLSFAFYLHILVPELHTPLALEGVNYVGDTLLFAGLGPLTAPSTSPL